MKTKAKKLVTHILTALLVLSILPMNVFAAQREVTASSTASITINSAVENDVLAAYKVVDITYVAETNTLTYAWNSNFADYFAGTTSYNATAYTVEQFDALTDDPDTLKTLLAGLPNYISAKTLFLLILRLLPQTALPPFQTWPWASTLSVPPRPPRFIS